MCGIIGYIGDKEAVPILLEGLKKLEYRGYDSAGMSVLNGEKITTVKRSGKIADFERIVLEERPGGTIGIAHTRWATHGAPTTENAHPHTGCKDDIVVVHNGIIENCTSLREKLEMEGHVFKTDTDTEVLAHLIERYFEGKLEDAVRQALRKVEGTYGLVAISSRDPDKIVAARLGSPLVLGIANGDYFVASDVSAIVLHTRQVIYLDDGEMLTLTKDGYTTTDLNNIEVFKNISEVTLDIKEIQKGGYPHFMLKEIMEQPASIKNTMRGRLLRGEGNAKFGGLNLTEDELREIERIVITACGTSWHAALIGEYMIEELARVPVEVEYASEFRYRDPIMTKNSLVIAISQSGETADTLAAMREARKRGAKLLGIVNVVGSQIAREADGGIYIHAGPEIGVASTKAFTSQITALALFTLLLGRIKGEISKERGSEIIAAMERLPHQVEEILKGNDQILALSRKYHKHSNFLYLGRGYNFPAALEGALKMKEISYIHAEGYPAAEMKHGPIALIDENMPVVFIAVKDSVHQKVLSNIQEVKARQGRVIAIANEGDSELEKLADYVITVPETMQVLSPILTTVPLQLLAYHVAVLRGCDVDKPRNLAKSVTVE
ncbi:MAG: glutamine--fructose-6-phosphate transaminase (isomerizing) [Candidatus Glassbacteria bacterium]